jgi:hypothetical protein
MSTKLILISHYYLLFIPINTIHNCHTLILESLYSYLIMFDSSPDEIDEQRCIFLLQIAGMIIAATAAICAAPLYVKILYYTSTLYGEN